jgi:alpha-tubulin suppressor-like RCC1 family protein/serine/threonine protein kinase
VVLPDVALARNPQLVPGATYVTESTVGAEGSSTSLWPRELDADYEVLGELGRGGMAVVFRARDRELGREVAIKVVRPRFVADEEAIARLAREARTVAQLEHPNIVGVYAIRHLSDKSVALVMQLVPGRTLKEALQQDGPFEPARAEHVLRDVARALSYAHQAGVVHRDVKPENIFLDDVSGRAMLSDFGVARVMDAPTELTATGTTIGTPTYMPPEQIDGGEIDGRSDLYSLGMVGWEMLAGQRPWSGESLYSVIYRQKHDPLPPLDALRKDVPPRLQFLLEGMMQKSPERRWAGASRFLTLLASDQSPPGFREWQSAQRRRRRSMVYQQGRSRGESVLEAALETMKFNRDATPPAPPLPILPTSATDDASGFRPLAMIERALTPPELRQVRAEPRSTRRGIWIALAVGAVLIVVGALWHRQRLPRTTATATPTITLQDRPGREVPVVPPVYVSPSPTISDSLRAAVATDSPPSTPRRAEPPPSRAPSRASATRSVASPAKSRPAPGSDSTSRAAREHLAASSRQEPPRSTTSSPVRAIPPLLTPTAPEAPTLNFPTERANIAAGGRHSCMLVEGGRALCWGNNDAGQLGDGSYEGRASPAPVAGDFAFIQILAASWHTCGLTSSGDAYCWGKNDLGQLGDGTTAQRAAPVHVNINSPFRAVRLGDAHSCALTRAGSVYCWGANTYGQLGDGTRTARSSPVLVGVPAPAAALAVGLNHTCALMADGTAYCWGQNRGGQLGDGTTLDRTTPTAVATELRFVSVAAGSGHTCGVTVSGAAFCWGQNNYGQLGAGVMGGSSLAPKAVETSAPLQTVVAGIAHTCARGRDGHALCWGRNVYGQLGDGTTTDRSRPVAVAIGSIASIHASGAHSCAVTTAGEAYCWGYNIDGQLGDGDRENASSPSRVRVTR